MPRVGHIFQPSAGFYVSLAPVIVMSQKNRKREGMLSSHLLVSSSTPRASIILCQVYLKEGTYSSLLLVQPVNYLLSVCKFKPAIFVIVEWQGRSKIVISADTVSKHEMIPARGT